MAINYPTSLDDGTSLPIVVDTVTDVLAVHQNDPRLAIIALEGKVGITASTPTLGTLLKGTGTGSSEWGTLALDDLSDVVISNPTLDQRLRYNGTAWVNADPVSVSAGNGVEFFPDTTDIIAKSTENDFVLETLNKTPVTTAESIEAISCANNTVIGSGYLYNTALGRTTLDAGVWNFMFYASVSSVAAGRVSSLTQNLYKVSPYTDPTVSITGSGTSRTCTASSGTPFATSKIDASATNTTASFVRTPKGVYQITARTSDTEVTISTPTGYSNESTVAFSVWKRIITSTTPTITSTGTNYSLYTTNVISDAITVAVTDKLGMIIFGTSNNTTTVNYVYNGTTHYSHINTPLAILHNNLPGLQGGTSNEYYHSTSAQNTAIGTLATMGAESVLIAVSANTPVALTVGASTIVGRKATGDIVALTAAETRTILNVADGATANTKASGAEITTGTDDAKFATAKALADAGVNTRLKSKIITVTRDMATASGDVSYTGVGFTPSAMVILSCETGTGYLQGGGVGVVDSSLIDVWVGVEYNSKFYTNAYAINVDFDGSNKCQGTVKSFDSDGFTITWVKVGTPTGTVTAYCLCLK